MLEDNSTEPNIAELSEKEKALVRHKALRENAQAVLAAEEDIPLHINEILIDADWPDYANCLGVDPELFFPGQGASTREAKSVCAGCVVHDECLEYALSAGLKFGIWGGASERERRRMRRQRRIARRQAAQAVNGTEIAIAEIEAEA